MTGTSILTEKLFAFQNVNIYSHPHETEVQPVMALKPGLNARLSGERHTKAFVRSVKPALQSLQHHRLSRVVVTMERLFEGLAKTKMGRFCEKTDLPTA
jgi:hypothetical protein